MRPAEYVGRLGHSSTRLSTTGRYDAQRGQPKDTLSALREDIMHSYEEACDELEVPRGGEAMETPRRSRHVSSLRRHIREADETTAIVETQTRAFCRPSRGAVPSFPQNTYTTTS
jgi:hypothetical protein